MTVPGYLDSSLLVQMGIAAQRWHTANVARRAAARVHRAAKQDAEQKSVFHPSWAREREAEKMHAVATARERAARRALEKLCAARADAINVDMLDVREVMEGQP